MAITGSAFAQAVRDEVFASWSRQLKAHPDSIWGIVAFDAASLAFFWLLAWIVVGAGRWVAAGFQKRTV
jgi:hypothetical protein